ncbi:glycosyltransferase family 2 protein [Cellulomonas algicola]|uniref:Glycosyltransferase 2-like domain-containing protein n=1 Tax=Cellulomonas algicola TaxID=2071633 RepID=A0A401V1R3_9CELL|nr:glycosyltransferase family 2 protein [Cellulomonas algicola]GCD20839.1 hypothetical protein CTKZ_24010 [Cellulomonas algicola]
MTDQHKRTLDVVVPLYNEAEGIDQFHAVLVDVLESVGDRYEWSVVYVVDPSSDGTSEHVRQFVARDERVRAVLLLRRAGHQMSLVAGMEQTTADAVITMDGDLQHPPELIPRMLELFESGVDVVQTVRAKTHQQGVLGRTASRGFYRVMRRLSEVSIVEGGADFRLMSARVVRILTREIPESDRFLRGLIPWLGVPTETLEFTAPARAAGRSKYSFGRSLSLAASGLVSFSKAPLHVGIVLGAVVSLLGLVAGLVALVMKLSGAGIPEGWATLVVLVAILSGVQLMTLGLIGLYVGVIFDEAKKRPQILVDELVVGRTQGPAGVRSQDLPVITRPAPGERRPADRPTA